MAETLSLIDNNIFGTRIPNNRETSGGESAECSAPADKSRLRTIEFHLARKPFTGFTNGGGDGSFQLETLNPTTRRSLKNNDNHQQSVGLNGVGGGSSGKKRDALEMENGLDPELSFGITFRRIGAGLENLGNTCFLNSVLQCLTYTEPLAAYLQSGKHQVTCKKSGFCALCAIQKHVSRALQSSGRSLAPKDLVSNLRCISRTFRNSRQEDAHEYMVNLLESMHKCCLPTGVPSESQSAYDRSLVHKIFGGRLRSQVKCMQCNYCSNKFDPILDLSLEILKADTLYKAFANFTAKEQLDGGAKQYQCQQCKQKVKALKQLTIYKAPNVLTIHLKRFGSYMSGQKIDKKIEFGSTLDLKPFVTGPYDGDLKYTLYGVLVHAGWSTHSGHYYCFVRTSSGMWYSLDDNRVFQVSEKKVFEQKAYMLFYFRDGKNFPSKKPADVIHQKKKMTTNDTKNGPGAPKETQTNPGLSNSSSNGHKSSATVGTERCGFSLGAPKETQTNPSLSNGNGHKSLATVGTKRSGSSPKETQTNPGLSNGSLINGHRSLAAVSTERSGFSPGAPKETQMNLGLSNASLNGFKSSLTVGAESCGFNSKETQMNPGVSNGSLNGHKYSATVGAESSGFSPKEDKMNPVLSNGSLNGHKSATTVGTERSGFGPGSPKETQMNPGPRTGSSNGHKSSGFSTGAPGPTPKTQGSVPKSISESRSKTSKCENGDFGNSTAITVAKPENGNPGKEIGQKAVVTAATEISDMPKMESSLTEKKALAQKTHKKTKKFLKCKVTSMKISSNVLMRASLNQRKMKKQKRNKRIKNLATQENSMDGQSKQIKNLATQEHSMDERSKWMKNLAVQENSINEGPSSSDRTESLKAIEKELKKRVEKDNSVLATRHFNGVPNGSQVELEGSNGLNDCRRSSSNQKDLVHMLTRGLEDRTVPRWDEDDSTPSQTRETMRVPSIGYIGDEWDEEYDRGKRKKVRMSSTEFDGKNPFQELANERQKSQAVKYNLLKKPSNIRNNKQFKKSRTGNGPLRI